MSDHPPPAQVTSSSAPNQPPQQSSHWSNLGQQQTQYEVPASADYAHYPNCERCGYTISHLNVHMQKHWLYDEDAPFKCVWCQLGFLSLVGFEKHCQLAHQAPVPPDFTTFPFPTPPPQPQVLPRLRSSLKPQQQKTTQSPTKSQEPTLKSQPTTLKSPSKSQPTPKSPDKPAPASASQPQPKTTVTLQPTPKSPSKSNIINQPQTVKSTPKSNPTPSQTASIKLPSKSNPNPPQSIKSPSKSKTNQQQQLSSPAELPKPQTKPQATSQDQQKQQHKQLQHKKQQQEQEQEQQQEDDDQDEDEEESPPLPPPPTCTRCDMPFSATGNHPQHLQLHVNFDRKGPNHIPFRCETHQIAFIHKIEYERHCEVYRESCGKGFFDEIDVRKEEKRLEKLKEAQQAQIAQQMLEKAQRLVQEAEEMGLEVKMSMDTNGEGKDKGVKVKVGQRTDLSSSSLTTPSPASSFSSSSSKNSSNSVQINPSTPTKSDKRENGIKMEQQQSPQYQNMAQQRYQNHLQPHQSPQRHHSPIKLNLINRASYEPFNHQTSRLSRLVVKAETNYDLENGKNGDDDDYSTTMCDGLDQIDDVDSNDNNHNGGNDMVDDCQQGAEKGHRNNDQDENQNPNITNNHLLQPNQPQTSIKSTRVMIDPRGMLATAKELHKAGIPSGGSGLKGLLTPTKNITASPTTSNTSSSGPFEDNVNGFFGPNPNQGIPSHPSEQCNEKIQSLPSDEFPQSAQDAINNNQNSSNAQQINTTPSLSNPTSISTKSNLPSTPTKLTTNRIMIDHGRSTTTPIKTTGKALGLRSLLGASPSK